MPPRQRVARAYMIKQERRIAANLESKTEIAEGLAIFRFALAEEFHFKPGQYATLWLTHRGKTLPRPYSIASSPSETRVLEFYINLVEEGKLTPSLWDPDVLRALENRHSDTELGVTGPRGRFVLDEGDTRDLVFVASGTGLAPFVSMLRKLTEDWQADPNNFPPRRVFIVHGVSLSSHLGYRAELERMAAETLRDPARRLAVVYLPTVSRPHLDRSWTGLKGRAEALLEPVNSSTFTPSSLQDIVRSMMAAALNPKTHAVYVCGHPGTIDGVVRHLKSRGFEPDADIRREKYYP